TSAPPKTERSQDYWQIIEALQYELPVHLRCGDKVLAQAGSQKRRRNQQRSDRDSLPLAHGLSLRFASTWRPPATNNSSSCRVTAGNRPQPALSRLSTLAALIRLLL